MLRKLSSDSYYVLSFSNPLRHLHISHNAPYLPPPPPPPPPPKKKKKFPYPLFFISPGYYSRPKILGANKVQYGICASGVLPGL